ncbi:MAG: hypothetical protein ACI9YL_000359 [Luteibaculaceae bacterium]
MKTRFTAMRLIVSCALSLFSLLPLFTVAQDYVEWDEYRDLSVDDFQQALYLKHVETFRFQNGLELRLEYRTTMLDSTFFDKLNTSVVCMFFPYRAMLQNKDNAPLNDLLELANVQFDLAEVNTRRIRRFLSENPSIWSSQRSMRVWFDKFYKNWKKQDKKLAKKSDHGLKKDVLDKWRERISEEMEYLADYCYSCSLSEE